MTAAEPVDTSEAKKPVNKFTALNHMDPGEVPDQLKGLTRVEQLLIARIIVIMCVFKLPLGQNGYTGNVINIPQHVEEIAKEMPRDVNDTSVLVLRKEGASGSFKDFRVRRQVVKHALLWLKANNPYYKDITISEERLSQLPFDGSVDPQAVISPNLPHPRAEVGISGCAASSKSSTSSISVRMEAEPECFTETTFVPNAGNFMTEEEMRAQKAEELLGRNENHPPVPWPSRDHDSPINEFKTLGYVCQAFPTLFPYGKADLREDRAQEVSAPEYFQHLMRWRDGRFARHWQFPYFALNTVLRHSALRLASWVFNTQVDEEMKSFERLMELANREQSALMKKIVRFSCTLPGSKHFWLAKRAQLIQMVDQLKQLPTIFFTLSSADLQWPELHKLFAAEEYRTRTQAVIENPAVCDYFFVARVKHFLEIVMKKHFKMRDYWGRFEFQHRGSVHFHCLAWLNDAPDAICGLNAESSEEVKMAVVQYFDELITAWNPGKDDDGKDLDVPEIRVHPSSVPYFKIQNHGLDKLGLLMYLNRHKCRVGFCQKIVGGLVQKCRFDFPKDLAKESLLVFSTDDKTKRQRTEFVPKRNDPYVNCHNEKIAKWHRANTDLQAIVDIFKVMMYCAKYVTKSEPQSDMLKLLTTASLTRVSYSAQPLRLICQKALTQVVGNRDYGSQETAHILLGYDLALSSRTFINIHLDGKRKIQVEDGEPVLVSNMIDNYMKRDRKYANSPLLQYYRENTVNGEKATPRQKGSFAIAIHHVRKVDRQHPSYEDFCRQYLLLHKPFDRVSDLRSHFDTYAESYEEFCQGQAEQHGELESVGLQEAMTEDAQELQDDDLETDDGEARESSRVYDDAAALLRLQPNFPDQEEGGNVDWTESYRNNEDYIGSAEFYRKLKESVPELDDDDNVDLEKLNVEQRYVYDEVEQHLNDSQLHRIEPLMKIVCGTAGTGKTYLIRCLKKLLGPKLLTIEPTGCAACNVGGQTINSGLRIPAIVSEDNFADLRNEVLALTQEQLREVRYVILEEMSMVGLRRLAMIERRLKQIFPSGRGQLFGGCSVLLVGDFGQLAPVSDIPLYAGKPKTPMQLEGAVAYQSFRSCTVLQAVLRQEEDAAFRNTLMRIRRGEATMEDYALLKTRFVGAATVNLSEFKDAIRLFSTVAAVEEYNNQKLFSLSVPLANIEAHHARGGRMAKEAESDDAGGLEPRVRLAKGAKIMLTANLHVPVGLCNGTVGTVVDIVYSAGGPPDLPEFVLCEFPGYVGPQFIPGQPKLFPVRPLSRTFSRGGRDCERTGIPLRLAWAVTIHKSQGLTLDKAVVDIGDKEFSAGLTFVALSRVRKLNDLHLAFFPHERLFKIAGTRLKPNKRLQEMKAEDDRLISMSNAALDLPFPPMAHPSLLMVPPQLSTPDRPRTLHGPVTRSASAGSQVQHVTVPFSPLTLSDRERFRSLIPEGSSIIPGADRYGRKKKMSTHTKPKDRAPITGDGKCFYNAVSRCLYGTEEHNQALKDLVKAFVEDEENDIVEILSDEDQNTDELLRQELLLGIEEHQWADELHIKLMARMLGVSIWVFWPAFDGLGNLKYQWKPFHPPQQTQTGIYLFFCKLEDGVGIEDRNANHFELVLKV